MKKQQSAETQETADSLIPLEWLDDVKMHRIILHWTYGWGTANSVDKEHYHILVQQDGSLVRGNHSIADNVSSGDGDYAAHTLNCNGGSIGVSLCGMVGAKERPFDAGDDPITEEQWLKGCQVVAELCKFYEIDVTPQTVLNHGEVQKNLGIMQRGKWDVLKLPWEPSMGPEQVANEFRKMVNFYLQRPTNLTVVVKDGKKEVAYSGEDVRKEDGQFFIAARPLSKQLKIKLTEIRMGKLHYMDNDEVPRDIPVEVEHGVGFVSVADVAEEFGFQKDYDAGTKTATLTRE